VKTRSFSEKDIIAKVTFDSRPSQANMQKRAFRDKIDAFVKSVGGSAYTDITGGLIQGGMYLNETGAEGRPSSSSPTCRRSSTRSRSAISRST